MYYSTTCDLLVPTVSPISPGWGRVGGSLTGKASCIQPWRCSSRRWVCPPDLFHLRRRNVVSTSASDGTLSSIWKGEMFICNCRPGGRGGYPHVDKARRSSRRLLLCPPLTDSITALKHVDTTIPIRRRLHVGQGSDPEAYTGRSLSPPWPLHPNNWST